MHFRIAKILDASGKGEEIDRILQGREEITCLASDGSTDVEKLLAASGLISNLAELDASGHSVS